MILGFMTHYYGTLLASMHSVSPFTSHFPVLQCYEFLSKLFNPSKLSLCVCVCHIWLAAFAMTSALICDLMSLFSFLHSLSQLSLSLKDEKKLLLSLLSPLKTLHLSKLIPLSHLNICCTAETKITQG